MATQAQTAAAFAHKLAASCHNANTGAGIYQLHGHTIAKWETLDFGNGPEEVIRLLWCGFYTPTTASHMNEILKALDIPMRVSYARARDLGIKGYDLTMRDGKLFKQYDLHQ
jgi:hypothetical protein